MISNNKRNVLSDMWLWDVTEFNMERGGDGVATRVGRGQLARSWISPGLHSCPNCGLLLSILPSGRGLSALACSVGALLPYVTETCEEGLPGKGIRWFEPRRPDSSHLEVESDFARLLI